MSPCEDLNGSVLPRPFLSIDRLLISDESIKKKVRLCANSIRVYHLYTFERYYLWDEDSLSDFWINPEMYSHPLRTFVFCGAGETKL